MTSMTKILHIPSGQFVLFYTTLSGPPTTWYENTHYFLENNLSAQEFIDHYIVDYFMLSSSETVFSEEFTTVVI